MLQYVTGDHERTNIFVDCNKYLDNFSSIFVMIALWLFRYSFIFSVKRGYAQSSLEPRYSAAV